MNSGQRIIDFIISNNLVASDARDPNVLIWSGGACEQLEAFVENYRMEDSGKPSVREQTQEEFLLKNQLAAVQLKAKSAMPEELWRRLVSQMELIASGVFARGLESNALGGKAAIEITIKALKPINTWKKEQNL